jgi:cystathionine gamma-lyase
LLKPGDTLTCISDVYGGTQRLFNGIAHPLMQIKVNFIDFTTVDETTFKDSAMIWLETPTNPTLTVTDIRKISQLKHSAILCVDNTFATPYFQNPLLLGADVVVHSVTKYLNGHSDVVMGVVCTSVDAIHVKLRYHQNAAGAVPSPFDCYLALRGLKTLHVRMAACESNTLEIAHFLSSRSTVTSVIYPGLTTHPQHDLAKEQMSGFGGIISFYLKGDLNSTTVFLETLKIVTTAESLGAVESLAECPAIMTHHNVAPERRAELGISDTLVRLSVGLEGVEDLIEDLGRGLDAVDALEGKK